MSALYSIIVANMWRVLFLVAIVNCVISKLDDEDSSGDQDLEDSVERIGAMVAQAYMHPYAASLSKNGSYLCSAVVLNTYWLLTLSKCFDSDIISSYVTHKNLSNFTIRTGSSYNNKGGTVHKIKMLLNNFDLRVTALKLDSPLEFNSQVENVKLPDVDDDVTYGFLAGIVAWTPTGHMRVVNAPILEPTICEPHTRMLPGQYICLGGVQDPNRHFCRRDNGGAVIQNNTLIGISSFTNICALYSKTHAFPKLSNFVHWLNSIIWDEEKPPTTEPPTVPSTSATKSVTTQESTQNPPSNPHYADPSKFLLTLPFAPINVPLEPSEYNSVLPGMSLYEAYLQNLSKSKTSTPAPDTTENPMRYNSLMAMRMPMGYRNIPNKYGQFQYL